MADQIMLREKGKEGTGKPFAPDHAKRLLAYPGSAWEEVPAEKAPKADEPKADEAAKDAKAGK